MKYCIFLLLFLAFSCTPKAVKQFNKSQKKYNEVKRENPEIPVSDFEKWHAEKLLNSVIQPVRIDTIKIPERHEVYIVKPIKDTVSENSIIRKFLIEKGLLIASKDSLSEALYISKILKNCPEIKEIKLIDKFGKERIFQVKDGVAIIPISFEGEVIYVPRNNTINVLPPKPTIPETPEKYKNWLSYWWIVLIVAGVIAGFWLRNKFIKK